MLCCISEIHLECLLTVNATAKWNVWVSLPGRLPPQPDIEKGGDNGEFIIVCFPFLHQ